MSIYNLPPYIGNTPLIGGYNLLPYIGGVITRNFTTTDSAFAMSYTIPTYVMSVGDTIEFNYLAPTVASGSIEELIGGPGGGARFNLFNNGDFVEAGFDNMFLLDGVSTATNTAFPIDGKFHSILITSDSTLSVSALCNQQDGGSAYTGIMYDVIIKNSGGDIQRKYNIDQTWIGPSAILVETSGNNQHGTALNIDIDDSEPFTFNGSVSPNTWTNVGATRALEIAGT